MQPILLDTCAAIWVVEDAPLAQHAIDLLAVAADAGISIYVSPISAWEKCSRSVIWKYSGVPKPGLK